MPNWAIRNEGCVRARTLEELFDLGQLGVGGEVRGDGLDERLDEEVAATVALVEDAVVIAEEVPRERLTDRIVGDKGDHAHGILRSHERRQRQTQRALQEVGLLRRRER